MTNPTSIQAIANCKGNETNTNTISVRPLEANEENPSSKGNQKSEPKYEMNHKGWPLPDCYLPNEGKDYAHERCCFHLREEILEHVLLFPLRGTRFLDKPLNPLEHKETHQRYS